MSDTVSDSESEIVIPTSVGKTIILWFQRTGAKDSIMTIWRSNDMYHAKFVDPVHAPGKYARFAFDNVYSLIEYIELFFENIMVDSDEHSPYQYVQWDIPGFSTSIVGLENMEDRYIFRTFVRCLEFYFEHK